VHRLIGRVLNKVQVFSGPFFRGHHRTAERHMHYAFEAKLSVIDIMFCTKSDDAPNAACPEPDPTLIGARKAGTRELVRPNYSETFKRAVSLRAMLNRAPVCGTCCDGS